MVTVDRLRILTASKRHMKSKVQDLAESMPTCARHFILGLRTVAMGVSHPKPLTSCPYVNLPVLINQSPPLVPIERACGSHVD
jgi:hypothetical protein